MEQYCKSTATLLVGLGGLGSRIVDIISENVGQKDNVEAFCIDCDKNELRALNNIPPDHIVPIGSSRSVSDICSLFPDCEDWISSNIYMFKTYCFNEYVPLRVLTRLAYENNLYMGRFVTMLEVVHRMADNCVQKGEKLNVSITSSLCGSTGSGIFIQIALLIRKYLKINFPTLDVCVHGEFIFPSYYTSLIISDAEKEQMRANTYAALKELNAINGHFCNGTPAIKLKYDIENQDEDGVVDLLPYDYCFIYNKNDGKGCYGSDIADLIKERLLGDFSSAIQDAFARAMRSSARKEGIIYGTISSREFLSESGFFRHYSSDNSTLSGETSKMILLVTSPGNIDLSLMKLSPDFILETIGDPSSKISATEYVIGMELREFDELKEGSGSFYKAYLSFVSRMPEYITLHLDKDWHIELPDIGAVFNTPESSATVPSDSFVFVSYSSKESDAANEIKRILEINGVSCWIAPQSIPAGSDYAQEIPQAISKCKVLLLLLSKASQESIWVPKEVGTAISEGKIVIPFHIDDSDINAAFNFFLTNTQRISAYNRLTEAFQELIDRLKELLN